MSSVVNYSPFAAVYDAARPPYAREALSWGLGVARALPDQHACDIGAGTGRLTAFMATDCGMVVDAVEPNAEMREIGQHTTLDYRVAWFDGTAEHTGRPSGRYHVVTYGSCFNLVDQRAALAEATRILVAGGHVLCCWNHTDPRDPLAARVNQVINDRIPGWTTCIFAHDPTEAFHAHGWRPVLNRSFPTTFVGDSTAWCDAWRAHWTLAAQAGDQLDDIVAEITDVVAREYGPTIHVRHTTRVWVASLAEPPRRAS